MTESEVSVAGVSGHDSPGATNDPAMSGTIQPKPGKPVDPGPSDLTGPWTFGQETVLDGPPATDPDPGSATDPVQHGTYVRMRYFYARATALNNVSNAKVLVFDDAGNFTRFDWDHGRGKWVAPAAGVSETFATPKGSVQIQKDQSLDYGPSSTTLYPCLQLTAYPDPKSLPSGALHPEYVETVGDGSAAVTMVEQTLSLQTDGTLIWATAALPEGLSFNRVFQQPRAVKPGGDAFGNVFVGQISMPQMAFPFYGFYPPGIDLGNPAVPYASKPGTPTIPDYSTNPNQTFNGTLIFAFPTKDSIDYVRGVDVAFAPFLPMGLTGVSDVVTSSETHALVMSTSSERAHSWSQTFGLSAGVEKMLSVSSEGSYKQTIETQQQNESRYSVARQVSKQWVTTADIPSAKLHPAFVAALRNIVLNALAGTEPDWAAFVTNWGSHYAHAMTQGSIEVTETRFSLDVESTAHTSKTDLKVAAEGVLDGFTGKTNADVASEWSTKNQLSVSDEDVTFLAVGAADKPMGIFFDLRPITELLGPLLVPYNPLDATWGQFAPYVWHTLRASLENYLTGIGLGQTLQAPYDTDFTPHVTTFAITHISVSTDDERWEGGTDDDPVYAIGSFTSAKSDSTTQDQQFTMQAGSLSVHELRIDAGNGGANLGSGPGSFLHAQVSRESTPASMELSYHLNLFSDDDAMNAPADAEAIVSGTTTVTYDPNNTGKAVTVTLPRVKEQYDLAIYYTLSVTVHFDEVGLADYPVPAT